MTVPTLKHSSGELWMGDCLDLMARIPDGSVDMVLCDLPYGTTQCKWDSVIPFEPLWQHYWRVCRPGAAVVLTAAQPFTSALVMSQVKRFKYDWVWDKGLPTGHLNAKKMPLRYKEDVLVFYNAPPVYNPQKTTGHKRKIARTTYEKAGEGEQVYGKEKRDTFYDSDERYPKGVIEISNADRSKGGQHPTQKPIALFEYLIKTYTHEGMTVLDNCAGSGTTAIAAHNTGRRWICIEREPSYYLAAMQRILSECV